MMGLRAGDDDAGRERLGGRLERFNYRLRPQCIINDFHSLTSRHLSLARPCFSGSEGFRIVWLAVYLHIIINTGRIISNILIKVAHGGLSDSQDNNLKLETKFQNTFFLI